MRLFFGSLLLISIIVPSFAYATTPLISVSAEATGKYTVDVAIETDLPVGSYLGASLSLADQDPDDTYIGVGTNSIVLESNVMKISLNGEKSSNTFPSGEYEVEVYFYPNWSQNKGIAEKEGISEPIMGVSRVTLVASGEDRDQNVKRVEQRKWVMGNVGSGDSWDPVFWTNKFGSYEEVELQGGGNKNILKMYYFPSIDMTLKVNQYKQQIVTWRMGLAHK